MGIKNLQRNCDNPSDRQAVSINDHRAVRFENILEIRPFRMGQLEMRETHVAMSAQSSEGKREEDKEEEKKSCRDRIEFICWLSLLQHVPSPNNRNPNWPTSLCFYW
jgi:hypothetical protein